MNKLAKQAFTLIELLVVIAIIGILSGLIVVSMSGVTSKANVAKAQVFSNSLRDSLMLNIISEWKMDEVNVPSAGQVFDSWGSNNGVLVGTSGDQNLPQLQTSGCVSGNCFSFDGTDDYININGGNTTLDLSNGYTAEGWAKYDTLTGNRGLLRRYYSDSTAWFILAYRNTSNTANRIQCAVLYTDTSNTSKNLVPIVYIQENKWYHFALTVGADGVTKFYVNGVTESPYVPVNFLRNGAVSATNTTELAIGGYGYYLDGMIDNVRMYNVPLSDSQVKNHYYAGVNSLLASGGINLEEYKERILALDLNNRYGKR